MREAGNLNGAPSNDAPEQNGPERAWRIGRSLRGPVPANVQGQGGRSRSNQSVLLERPQC